MSDPLGYFLTAYDEYLDGKRAYEVLPRRIYSGERMSDPYRTAPSMPKTLTETRLDALESDHVKLCDIVLKWAGRTTWNLAAIMVLMIAVGLLSAYVAEQRDAIRQLQHDVAQLRCYVGWRAPVGGDGWVVP